MSPGVFAALAVMCAGLLLTAAGLAFIAVDAMVGRYRARRRLRRQVEAMWREVYRLLGEADTAPRTALSLQRRRVAGVRMPRIPGRRIVRRQTTSSDRRH